MNPIRFPWDSEPAPVVAPLPPPAPKKLGRRPAAVTQALRQALVAPDWRYYHLTVSGPAETLAGFAAAARGPGVIPWQLDFERIEEDIFNLAAAQPPARRNLSVAGCHVLARQFRERVEARQAQAAALVGRSRACPFDLQVLLPVPDAILSLGPTHPAALSWLAGHWGITDRLRQVVERAHPSAGRRLAAGHAVIGYGFFTANEAPAPALARLVARWPALRFRLRPRPAD